MGAEREEPRQLQAETLFAAWASRVEAGEELDFEQLVRANTELEPELRALHDDWKHFAPILGNVVPGLIASGDGLVLPSLTRGPDVDEEPPSDELLEKLGLHAPDTKRYRFRGRIGTGGQGVVLKVWDAKLSRPLAMKIVLGRAQDQPTGQTPRVDGRRLTRFVDEARIASQLNHPGIVPVHELGADESGRAFFTMKLVKGDDLSRIFDKAKRGEDGIGLPRAVSYLLRVCEAMAYAHDRGVIHRDLKPANVMVGAYGEVHVMDWGLARVIGDAASDVSAPRARPTEPISQVDSVRRAERSVSPDSPLFTELGRSVGTPCYMSPEQARGDVAAVGPASDIYAVGAMLYQLLTGTPPYLRPGERRSPEFIAIATVEGPPPPVESLAPRAIPELVAICERAMARDPAARYASMRALASDLQAFLENRVVRAYETGAWAETRKWVKRNRALAGSLSLLLVTLAIGGTAIVAQRRSAELVQRERDVLRNITSIKSAAAALESNSILSAKQYLENVPEDQRRWEWSYLHSSCDTSLVQLDLGCQSMALSPNGETLAVLTIDAEERQSLKTISTETWKVVESVDVQIGWPYPLSSGFVYSPLGDKFAIASGSDVLIWSQAPLLLECRLRGHAAPVSQVSFAPSGEFLVSTDDGGAVIVWSIPLESEVSRIVRAAGVRAWFLPGGKQIALDRGDQEFPTGMVGAFDSNGAELVDFATGQSTSVAAGCRVTPGANGAALIAVSGVQVQYSLPEHPQQLQVGRAAHILMPDELVSLHSCETTNDGLLARVFASDYRSYVVFSDLWTSGDNDPVVSLPSGASFDVLLSPSASTCVAALKNSSIAVISSGRLTTSKSRVSTLRAGDGYILQQLAPNWPKSELLANFGGSVFVFSTSRSVELGGAFGAHGVVDVAFGPSSSRLASLHDSVGVVVWDAAMQSEVLKLGWNPERRSASVVQVEYRPTHGDIVTLSDDWVVRFWHPQTGQELGDQSIDLLLLSEGSVAVGLHAFKPPEEWPQERPTISFSRDGRRFACSFPGGYVMVVDVSRRKLVCLWSLADWEAANVNAAYSDAAFGEISDHVVPVAISPGDATTLLATRAHELVSFEPDNGSTKIVSRRNALRYSVDGSNLIAVDPYGRRALYVHQSDGAAATIYDLVLGVEAAHLTCESSFKSAVFSPDGSRIATTSWDGTVKIWDPLNGLELLRLETAGTRFESLAFDPSGEVLAAGTGDGTVILWSSVPEKERHTQREALKRSTPRAQQWLNGKLAQGHDWPDCARLLESERELDEVERRAAGNELSLRSSTAWNRASGSKLLRAESLWLRRMLGLESWPTDATPDATGAASPKVQWRMAARAVFRGSQEYGREAWAIGVAKRVLEERSDAEAQRVLARAHFCVGQFDEALIAQRAAVQLAETSDRERAQSELTTLEADIAEWRDENGNLRTEEWLARIAELEREIAEIEADPDVQIWLREKR